MQLYLVRMITSGKQRFIFGSIKRKEIVGASDLIARVDGQWVDDALGELLPGFSRAWRIERDEAELLMAGAGSAIVLLKDADRAKALVTTVTLRALSEAPGLDVSGVVCPFVWDGAGGLAVAIREARNREPVVRSALPPQDARFLRLPIADECSASGLPAAGLGRPSPRSDAKARSAVSLAKLEAYEPALDRLMGVLTGERSARPPGDVNAIVEHLGEGTDWVAVVHADGNGLGTIFGCFETLVGDADARGFVDQLRAFSKGVDACAHAAFRDAVAHVTDEGAGRFSDLPAVLPLVLGGDDLTVVCDGAIALPFTQTYLQAFADHTARCLGPWLTHLGQAKLGAAAGVAIVKRHYPFHFAYELCEQLMAGEAKQVKEELGSDHTALSFHVLHESAAADLGRLRTNGAASRGTALVAQPYVVGPVAESAPHPEWARGRHWDDLTRRVAALRRRHPETGELLLPSNDVHELQEGSFAGATPAAARLELLRRRFAGDRDRAAALTALLDPPEKEKGKEHGSENGNGARRITGLLDARHAADFLTTTEADA